MTAKDDVRNAIEGDVRLLLDGLEYVALCYGAEYGHGQTPDVEWALEGHEDVLDAYRRLRQRFPEGAARQETRMVQLMPPGFIARWRLRG